jgi:DNA primase
VPFVVFQVERILARAELDSAEGRDRALGELRPVLIDVPASVLRDELVRRVAGRLALSERRLATLLRESRSLEPNRGAGPASLPRAAGVPAATPLDTGMRAERTFLVMCIAAPDLGNAMLAEIDAEVMLTSDTYRRAARHLAGRAAAPLAELPEGDEELARVLVDLVERAGRIGEVREERLEHARLVLELGRADRAIARARTDAASGISELARQRESVLAAIHAVGARLERAL